MRPARLQWLRVQVKWHSSRTRVRSSARVLTIPTSWTWLVTAAQQTVSKAPHLLLPPAIRTLCCEEETVVLIRETTQQTLRRELLIRETQYRRRFSAPVSHSPAKVQRRKEKTQRKQVGISSLPPLRLCGKTFFAAVNRKRQLLPLTENS